MTGKLDSENSLTQYFTGTDYPMTIGASSKAVRKSVGYIDGWHLYKNCIYTISFTVSPRADTKADSQKHEVFSTADKIRKIKSLLDEGIISQKEFDAAKKKLPGL